jgi:hypothetical protein
LTPWPDLNWLAIIIPNMRGCPEISQTLVCKIQNASVTEENINIIIIITIIIIISMAVVIIIMFVFAHY